MRFILMPFYFGYIHVHVHVHVHSRCHLPYSSVAGDSAQNTAMGHMNSSVAAYQKKHKFYNNVKFDTNRKIVIQYKRTH